VGTVLRDDTPGFVNASLAAGTTCPELVERLAHWFSICGSQVHSVSALVPALTYPGSLDFAGNLLFLFTAFNILSYGKIIR